MDKSTPQNTPPLLPARPRPLHTRKSAWKLGWPTLSWLRPPDRQRPESALG
jgi:hypothetical protein